MLALLGTALGRPAGIQPRSFQRILPGFLFLAVVGFGLVNTWQLVPLQQGVQAAETDMAGAARSFDNAVSRATGLAIAWQQQGNRLQPAGG
jgi:hypothetical protein